MLNNCSYKNGGCLRFQISPTLFDLESLIQLLLHMNGNQTP